MILIKCCLFRPEEKENKEGADTEKAAEQATEPEELVKEKVTFCHTEDKISNLIDANFLLG